jgi:DNA-binding MarR family transcriptional regulator
MPTTGVEPGEAGAWTEGLALPALLRAARSTYGVALRPVLESAGFDDLPPNGAFVLGALARSGAPLAAVVSSLGASKQVAGKLVDTLVARGYLDRAVDPDDRRRLTVALTERGRAAAATVRSVVERVDAALEARVGAGDVAVARQVLGALVALRGSDPSDPSDPTRPDGPTGPDP